MNTKKIFLVGFLGNIFEWYDFSIYAYLATALSAVFFPKASVTTGLLEIFILFFISYLARPFGSVFFGYLGDKKGRGLSLKWSLFLMGIPSFLIGILPTYKFGGLYIVALFALLRIIQGFAAGGELPGSACYVYELSNKKNRNFFSSFVAASSMLGVLTGSLIVTAIFYVFSFQQVVGWVWRVPFLLGGFILVFLYKIRTQLQEKEPQNPNKINPLVTLFKNEFASIIKIVILYAFISVSFYLLFVWMPSYLTVYLHVPHKDSLMLSTTGLGLLIFFTLFFGYTARFIGKKNLIIFSMLSILLFSWPAFIMLGAHNLTTMFIVILFFSIFLGSIDGVIMSTMGNLFPKEVRCSGISIAFTFSTAIFGGGAPALCSYLINHTGIVLSPVFFLIAVCLIGLPVAFSLDKKVLEA